MHIHLAHPDKVVRRVLFFLLSSICLPLIFFSTVGAQSSGSAKWTSIFQEGGANAGGENALAAAADSQGNLYLTGLTAVPAQDCPPPEGCNQAVTIKYDSSGKALWKDWLATSNSPAAEIHPMDIALDSTGNAYLLFNFVHRRASDSAIVSEVVAVKYNPVGGRDWIKFIDSSSASGGLQRIPVQLAVSPEGNVYISYNEGLPDTLTNSAVTIKYDTAGHFLWSQTFNDASPTSAVAIGLDASENIYVDVALGTGNAGGGGDNGEIVKYNAAGNRLAAFGRGTIGDLIALHVDPDGACYFGGRAAHNGSPLPDQIVAKFNPNQSLAYLVDITALEGIGGTGGGPGSGPQGGIVQIASDSAGDAFVLQDFDQTGPAAVGEVISVLKLDPSGKQVFVTRYNSASDESGEDSPAALAVSPEGNVYVTGSSQLQPDTKSNLFEFVTIKYDSAGVRQWVDQYLGPGQTAGADVMALSGNNLFVSGGVEGITNGKIIDAWATINYVP